ncbi:MAG: hypothetical protein HQL30_08820 [Candidatus Omnitrophica bacterium]|nr:hypothetical protein [Candidatus Omnitrophota bacterium]
MKKNNNLYIPGSITSKPLRVLLSFIISFVLIMDNSMRAFSFGLDPGADIGTGNPVNELNIDTFTIPGHLGEIKRKFAGSGGNIVIHIQDAHCNKFAQGKISEILDFINKEYGIKTINLEGGTGSYDLRTFTKIPSLEVRRDVAEHYLEKGDINGAEFFAINNPGETELWGVEDKELYLANLKVYRDSLGYKGEVDKYIDELTYILSNLKRHIFGEKLLELDEAYAAYKAGTRDLRSYLDFLVKTCGANGIDTAGFRNISSLMRSVSMEGGINFDKANKEKEVLLDELKKALSKYDKEELVAKVLDFRIKKISMKGFYGYLIEKGRKCGIEKGRFSMLEKYLEYVICYEGVDVSAVMKEVDSLENAIKERLFANDAQRELSLLSKDLALLKNIFSISITKEDYGYYLAAKDGFAVRRYMDFIEKNAPLYKIQARPSPGIERLDSHREEIGAFFEYSFKRDDAFMRNMKFVECQGGKKAAVVMTGGFHTDNLADLFKGQGLSYVSIIPKFKNEDGYESPYFALLAGERADSFSEALRPILTQASAMQVASKLSSLGDSVWVDIEMEAWRGAVHIREMIEKEKKARGRDDIRVRLVRRGADGSIEEVKNNDGQPVVFNSLDNMKEDSPAIELSIDELVQNVMTYEIIAASPEALGQILSGSVAPEDVRVETATAVSAGIMERLSGKSSKEGEKTSGAEKGKPEVLNFVAVTDGKGKVRIVFGPENSTSHALLKEKGFKGVDIRKVWYGTLSAAGVIAKPQGEMSAEEKAKDEKLIKDVFKARGFQSNRTVQLKDPETVVFFVDPITGKVFPKEDRTGKHANVLNQIKAEYKNGINALLNNEVPDPVKAEIFVRINDETMNSVYTVRDGRVEPVLGRERLQEILRSIDGYFEHGSDILFRVFTGGYESEGEDGAKTEEKVSTTQQFADQEELDTFAMYKPSLYAAFLRYLKKAGINFSRRTGNLPTALSTSSLTCRCCGRKSMTNLRKRETWL